MRLHQRFWLWLICFALLGGPLAVAAAQDSSRPELTVRLHFGRPGGIFDPAYWQYTTDWFIYPNIYNWLVRWVPGTGGAELEADLAESWQISDDGLEYTFVLRQGVQFHGGYGEVTSEDVVFSFERQMTDETTSFYSQLSDVVSVEALDRYTFRLTLREPSASFMATVVAYRPGIIVSKAAVEDLGDRFNETPIGTGAFIFQERTAADEIVLVSNDDYFRGPPQVAKLTFAHIGEEQVAVAALQSNEFQIIWTRGNPEAIAALQADSDLTVEVISVPSSVRHVAFSPNFEPTRDPLVRQALAYAIDKDLIAQALPNLEIPAHVVYFEDSGEVPTYAYDPALARELLAQAGYPNGFPVTIMFQTRPPESILAELVGANWQDIGLTVTLEGIDAVSAFDRRNALEFEAHTTSVGRPDPDLLFTSLFLSTSLPPGGSNYMAYDVIDDLILEARRTNDLIVRADLYNRAHAQVMEDLPIIPLSYQAFAVAWRGPVTGMAHGQNNNFWGETIQIEAP